MRPVSRLLSRLVVTAALAALAILVPVFIDRRDYTVAVHNYAKNPTLDNGVVVAQGVCEDPTIGIFHTIRGRGRAVRGCELGLALSYSKDGI
jgi:hypothetical protein